MLPPAGQALPATPAGPAQQQPGRRFKNPWQAYQAGAYDQALQGFVDKQVERPDDPALWLNIGNVHYRIKDYEAAQNAFQQAALSGAPEVREQALYNLGNCAFRQGKLQDAVELYKQALDLKPDDEDAKFNLEYVRDEIRRRDEEAKKRQQQQQGQDQQQQQQDQQQQGDQSQQQDQGQDQQQQQQQGDQGQQGDQKDSDQDGLSDQTERTGANPTDPNNPDSDQDGLKDGDEDTNHNGQVDPGETDPNNPDSDGNGVRDGEQQAQQQQQAAQGEPQEAGERSLTPEEAERYLQALEEGQPHPQQPKAGRRTRLDKDW